MTIIDPNAEPQLSDYAPPLARPVSPTAIFLRLPGEVLDRMWIVSAPVDSTEQELKEHLQRVHSKAVFLGYKREATDLMDQRRTIEPVLDYLRTVADQLMPVDDRHLRLTLHLRHSEVMEIAAAFPDPQQR